MIDWNFASSSSSRISFIAMTMPVVPPRPYACSVVALVGVGTADRVGEFGLASSSLSAGRALFPARP